MVRVSSPAKLRPWSELTAKMVMGVVPGLVIQEFLILSGIFPIRPFPLFSAHAKNIPARVRVTASTFPEKIGETPWSTQKRPFVHNSACSQFLEVLFAVSAECSQFCLRSFNRNSRGNPSFCWLAGVVA